jgi:GAF domain-containing protein
MPLFGAYEGAMKERAGAGGVASKTLGRKATKLKRRNMPNDKARRSSVATNHEDDVARLTRELNEALEQQKTTAGILKVISRSTFDLKAVLDTLLQSAVLLCAAERGTMRQRDGDVLRTVASYGFSREEQQYFTDHPAPIDRRTATGRAIMEGKTIHISDVLADTEYRTVVAGYRTVLAVPMLRDGTTIGIFGLGRSRPSRRNRAHWQAAALPASAGSRSDRRVRHGEAA